MAQAQPLLICLDMAALSSGVREPGLRAASAAPIN